MSCKVSVIICTHNPDHTIFSRCLEAVARLQKSPDIESEIIIVDNRSSTPLAEREYVQTFVSGDRARRIVVEDQPGLTYARLAGLKAAQGEILVFMDDDNLPAPNYLEAAKRLFDKYPSVAVWGPGIIDVVWEDGATDWSKGFAAAFQAKNRQHTEFGRVVGWPNFFPAGTGMVVRRTVLEKYADQVERGQLSALDRCGKRMTSGGDGQIVWSAVKMGLCAGISPDLRLRHFIASKKANLGYICRMVFGVMASGPIALVESFPEEKETIGASLPGAVKFHALVMLEMLKIVLLFRVRSGPVHMAGQLGELYGQHVATGRRPPYPLRMAARVLDFA